MTKQLLPISPAPASTVILANESHDVAYWAEELNVSRSRIKEAIKAVGPMLQDVKAWLARN